MMLADTPLSLDLTAGFAILGIAAATLSVIGQMLEIAQRRREIAKIDGELRKIAADLEQIQRKPANKRSNEEMERVGKDEAALATNLLLAKRTSTLYFIPTTIALVLLAGAVLMSQLDLRQRSERALGLHKDGLHAYAAELQTQLKGEAALWAQEWNALAEKTLAQQKQVDEWIREHK